MSSNIKLQKICEHCGREFTARTTVTRFCGDDCAKRNYKKRAREAKIAKSNHLGKEENHAADRIKEKDFLTVGEAAALLSCSKRTIYNYIIDGKIKAGNPSTRMTRIPRSEINRLFY